MTASLNRVQLIGNLGADPKSIPSIYVACLASYNNAILHGVWIDAMQSEDDIMKEIWEMLDNRPEPNAEEYAIHDYE